MSKAVKTGCIRKIGRVFAGQKVLALSLSSCHRKVVSDYKFFYFRIPPSTHYCGPRRHCAPGHIFDIFAIYNFCHGPVKLPLHLSDCWVSLAK